MGVNVSALRGVVAGFQVSIHGRFWVSTEGVNPLANTSRLRFYV